jgi:hypothetical protein
MPPKKNNLKPLAKTAQTAISGKGYTILKSDMTPEQITYLKDTLTFKPKVMEGYGKPEDVRPIILWRENERKIYIPRFFGYKKIGKPKQDKLNPGQTIQLAFNGSIRPYQQEILAAWDKQAAESGGGIISVGPGRGKTVMAIAKLVQLGLKTLIVVHTSDLLDQWRERIEQYAPTARIGEIRGKTLTVMNKDVVIGMIQSLSNPKKDAHYSEELFKEFGFVIYDECHHVAAEMFNRCLRKTQFKYTMGLSATPDREDGLTNIFKYYLGDICYKDDAIQKTTEELAFDHIPDADVRVYKYLNYDPKYSRIELNYQGRPNVTTMETNIVNFAPRTEFVLSLLPPLISEGRKIIILTSRRDHIADLLEQITQLGIASCGPYVGGMKLDARNETKAKQILVATYKMAEEGFDCQELDTLIMATPKKTKKSITQSCGRIMRKSKNVRTKIPLIIDVVDVFSSFGRWFKQRRQYYVSQNYRLAEFEVHCPDDTVKSGRAEPVLDTLVNTRDPANQQNRIVCTQEPKWIPGKAPEPVLDDEPDEPEPSAAQTTPDLAADWDLD